MSTPHDTPGSPKPLSGRTALITGAPRSIGRAITEALARDGANIVAHYRSRQQEAAELAQLLESRGSQVLCVTDEEYDGLQAVNNRAVFMVLREASRRVRDGGRIINISSSTTAYPQAGYAMYAASKVSSSMIARILAAELGPRDITSNSLIVGPIAAGFLSGDGAFDPGGGLLDRLAKASPAGRLGTPDDVAAVAAFLARPEASWINGQQLTVNGGAMI